MKVQSISACVAVSAMLFSLLACGGGGTSNVPPPSGTGEFLVVATDRGLDTYAIQADRSLSFISTTGGALFNQQMAVAGNTIYLPGSSRQILAFAMGSDGSLTPVAGSPFPGLGSADLAAGAAQRFFQSGNIADPAIASLAVFSRSDSGALTPVAGSPFTLGSYFPGLIAAHPSGDFLFMQGTFPSNDRVRVFRIGSNGAPAEVPGSPFDTEGENITGAGTGLICHPSGSFVLTSNFDTADVSVLKVDGSTGALSAIPESPFDVGAAPGGLAVTPNGNLVYVTSRNQRAVYGFAMNPTTGVLTPVPGSPFPTPAGGDPLEIAVSQAGTALYVSDHDLNRVAAFQIDGNTGALTPVSGSPFTTGAHPWSIAVVKP